MNRRTFLKTSGYAALLPLQLSSRSGPPSVRPLAGSAEGAELEKVIAFAYYPGLRKLEVRIGKPLSLTANREALFVAEVWRPANGRRVARRTFVAAEHGGRCLMELPALADAAYELRVYPKLHPNALVRRGFQHKDFPWLGNTLGKSDAVYPPFEPIRVVEREASVVLRTHRMNGFGLWDSVVSRGKEMLAAPITLRLRTDQGEAAWQFGEGRWMSLQPHRAVFQAEAITPALRIRTQSSLEYDGCMKVRLDLLPGERPQTIRRLWLEIPLKDGEAPLFHYSAFECMRRNYAGKTPCGGQIAWGPRPEAWLPPQWSARPGSDDGLLWTCRDIRPWQHVIKSDFVPYIWLGGAERGLAFFGANDKRYVLDPHGTVQTLERRGETLYLRVDFVNKPSVIAQERQVVFGLQASPTRPMPENWRLRHRVTPGMPGPVVCWGGYICADKYPESEHFNVADAIVDVRRTGIVKRAVFEQLDRERGEPWKRPWGGKGAPGFDTWLDRDFWWFVNQAKELHDRSDWRQIAAEGTFSPSEAKVLANPSWITYTEEHASDISRPEWEVFQDEWRADYPWTQPRTEIVEQMQPVNNFGCGHQAFPESYVDFSLYYQNEWMKRGIGVYFDNTMPYTIYNPLLSDAYYDEHGVVQPACSIWEQRAYYKRVWQLMNVWTRRGVPYPLDFAQHITNTLLLPLNTWNTVNLDIEWEWHLDPASTPSVREGHRDAKAAWRARLPFPSDLLLAETTGRQTGSMGDALHPLLGYVGSAKERPASYALSEWGMRAVHELDRANLTVDRAMWKFGYGTPRVRVVNYWSDEPPLAVNDPEYNKWLLLVRPEDRCLFLVVQTWFKADTQVTLTLDRNRLGFLPPAKVIDLDTKKPIPITGSNLVLPMRGPYGTRVAVIGGVGG